MIVCRKDDLDTYRKHLLCRVLTHSDLYIQVRLDLILVKNCVMYLQLQAQVQIESSSQKLQKILSALSTLGNQQKKIYSVSSVTIFTR